LKKKNHPKIKKITINNKTVSSIEEISSSDSIDKELTRKSLSMLLLFGEAVYQFRKNEIKIPNAATFQITSNIINGIKIIPSF